ncbi:hypothetical protein SNK03_011473 [Fusarium graminearum]|uniref:Chromosome 3, complete genome n=3 Tax=Fusarium sambucinum species complex TaxID=569360 RepID=I1S7C7_GIBZE|nr:hypothetical protein FGSG_12750 [Fusarium graminearum PH-1]EYB26271.1 hypothetical protein FG05_12750 [Fusarium graminearum]KAF5234868.1 hypothetical protein FAUST_7404 [Fusarium austroamericanum]ESU11474.1 hypothetical protein FGSG_12750 [Fusarium graminearum PH-1]PCD40383.1 hypothetical protein FGRA07_01654 [Fusarium graminearum]CAF3443055.1 unnamed protein product [Fusarium graminearum]|eukprot:XP_011324050.1 hypothetical protein FGSG_12750 [Fusarium graminearum PH-1]
MSLRTLPIRLGQIRAAALALRASHLSKFGIRYSSTAPVTIADGQFWRSLIPKPLRKENRQLRKKSREWNPATFFIVIFLLIGSMSIQMIALRNSFDRYMRQSEARIASLREVVEKIQRGETVDVEKALGTGDPGREADWEEMLKAIERDEANRKAKREKAERTEPTTVTATAAPVTEVQNTEPAHTAPAKPKGGSFKNFF